jgi:hypothetical protein
MIYIVLNNNQIVQEKGGGKEKCNEWERGRMFPSFGHWCAEAEKKSYSLLLIYAMKLFHS